jgi:hypothetical protein
MSTTPTAQATAAAEYRRNIGQDFTLMDAEDEEYLMTEEEVEAFERSLKEDEEAQRQRVNLAMFDYFYG